MQAIQVTADGTADPTVQSITRAYDTLGRLTKTTSHGNDTIDPNNTTSVKNQVVFTYNDLNQVTKSEQAHGGTVGVGTPAVQYGYDLGIQAGNIWVDNTRLEKVTCPDGRVIFYNFDAQGTLGDRVDETGLGWTPGC